MEFCVFSTISYDEMNRYLIMIKIYLFIFMLPFVAFAQDEVSNKELQTFLEATKENEDENFLLTSPQFKDCEAKFGEFTDGATPELKKNLRDCLEEQIVKGASGDEQDKKLLEIAQTLNLPAYNRKASKDANSIMDYLQKRMDKALYGYDEKTVRKKFSDQKFVNHDVFYQMYLEQIGKNTLLQVSQYCLENLGYKGPTNFLYPQMGKTQDGKDAITSLGYLNNVIQKIPKQERKTENFQDKYQVNPQVMENSDDIKATVKSITGKNNKYYWKDFNEYPVCSYKTEIECEKEYGKGKYRSVYLNKLMKDAEYALAANDPEKNLIKNRYLFCAANAIKTMCLQYKCNNSYNNSTPDKEKKLCKKILDIDVNKNNVAKAAITSDEVDIQLKAKKKKGFIACNLQDRLAEYRIMVEKTNEVKAQIKKLGEARLNKGFSIGDLKLYDSNNRKDGIDLLTSISSKELTDNVASYKDADKLAEELEEKCFDKDEQSGTLTLKEDAGGNKDCEPLLADLNSSVLDSIDLDTEAKTQLKLQQLQKIQDEKELEKFLVDNNLTQYKGRMKELLEGDGGMDMIKELIEQEFTNKRKALVDGLNEKFKAQRKIRVVKDASDADKAKEKEARSNVAAKTLAEIEASNDRVQTLFEYSNIVTSFLTLKDDKTDEEVGANTTGRELELKASEKDQSNNLAKYFGGDSGTASGREKGGETEYVELIDKIINFGEEKESN